MSRQKVLEIFGNKIRIRACGILIKGHEILLIKHKNLGEDYLWSPPGGEVEFGEEASIALQREFMEEANLKIKVKNFLFVHEFIKPPLHAIELFFNVELVGGDIKKGQDPELKKQAQIISEVAFINFDLIKKEKSANLHGILNKFKDPERILSLQGYYKF